jgi:hypothetical protein
MKSFKTFYSEAKKPKPGHNAAVLAKNISKVMSAVKKEEVEQFYESDLSSEDLNRIAKDHDIAAKKHSTAYKETKSITAGRNHEVAYNRHVDAAKAHREAANDKNKHSSEKLEKMSNHAWDATDHVREHFDEEVELDEGKNLTDTKSDWRSDKSATAKNWSHNKLIKVAKHDRSAEKEIKRRIASKEYVFSNEEADLDENIKGWKHAASDISKMRAAQGKTVKLVSLKKDGTESKMHDATKMFRSEDEAQEHHNRVTKLNPKSKIAHNMYVDGKHVKTLGA